MPAYIVTVLVQFQLVNTSASVTAPVTSIPAVSPEAHVQCCITCIIGTAVVIAMIVAYGKNMNISSSNELTNNANIFILQSSHTVVLKALASRGPESEVIHTCGDVLKGNQRNL